LFDRQTGVWSGSVPRFRSPPFIELTFETVESFDRLRTFLPSKPRRVPVGSAARLAAFLDRRDGDL